MSRPPATRAEASRGAGGGRAARPAVTDPRLAMQAARALAIEEFPYLDLALSAMVLVPVPGLRTVASDRAWRLYYGPERVLDVLDEDGMRALVSDWVHEVMHLLREHPERWDELGHPEANLRLFNIAGDALINADLDDLGLPLYPTDVTFDRLPDTVEASMTTEAIYLALLADPPGGRPRARGRGDCGSAAGGRPRDWEAPVVAGSGPGAPANPRVPAHGDLPPGAVPAGAPAVDPVPAVSAATADSIRAQTATAIVAARQRDPGSVPGQLGRWAAELVEPLVDWRAELRRLVSRVGSGAAAGTWDYSFLRPPRRRVPGVRMPGMVAPEPGRLAVVVDTSGSMSQADLDRCFGELRGIVAARGHRRPDVQVIACDWVAHPPQRLRDVRQLRLAGGGGTDMGAGIDAAAALRPRPDAIVVMTDGYTGWPETRPQAAAGAACLALLVGEGAGAVDRDLIDTVPEWIRVLTVPAQPER